MRPEERMAARLTHRLRLTPAVDVEALCNQLAELKSKQFPIEIDGICLDLKKPGKLPKVWISKNLSKARRRFTLAHEIGHIIIPWHTGSIVDDLDAPRSGARDKYREMEAEANRFAAELLMPSIWVVGLAERANHISDLMHSIVVIADVSYPAAFLRSMKYGKPGFVGAEVRQGVVLRSLRTAGTSSLAPSKDCLVSDIIMPAAYNPKILQGIDTDYYFWEMREELVDPGNDLPQWREILDEILLEIPTEYRQSTRASINAVIGNAIGKLPRGSAVERIYKRGIEAVQNRSAQNPWMNDVLKDKRFADYVLARSRDRARSVQS